MQIAIDIPEELACEGFERPFTEAEKNILIKAIGNGTPLPRCKDCKYFEYDSVAKMDGIPLIVAHEICSRWGDGCKSREDGYCFLFEPRVNTHSVFGWPEWLPKYEGEWVSGKKEEENGT